MILPFQDTSHFDYNFSVIRDKFYEFINLCFLKIAGLFGFPESPGMPTFYPFKWVYSSRAVFLNSLPKHVTTWPPEEHPQTAFEAIFGTIPRMELIPRVDYIAKDEGFYNFYLIHYKNMYFLPDLISEFLQIKLNLCLDLTSLEFAREFIFLSIFIYVEFIFIRTVFFWYLTINPYTLPWKVIVAAVDWMDDALQGLVPSVLGVNLTGSVVMAALGVLADSLNHLVFTMPYLASEGEEIKLFLDGELKDVILFHYLPILWYRHPIPNELREYWYNERPEIYEYLNSAYHDLGIKFTPDGIDEISNASISSMLTKTKLLSVYDFFAIQNNHNYINHLIPIDIINALIEIINRQT